METRVFCTIQAAGDLEEAARKREAEEKTCTEVRKRENDERHHER
jgi:hypothetical protein